MKWEYRILAFTQPDKTVFFKLLRVNYNDNSIPIGNAIISPILTKASKKELCLCLKLIKKASEKPVLWGDQEKLFKVYKKLRKKNEIIP